MACDQTEKGWTIGEGELDRADVTALLVHHFTEMRAESPPEACHVLPIDGLKGADIRVFALRQGDGTLLCIGALKTVEPGHGEVKSMRTHPAALGHGVGRAMLGHIVDTARSSGMTRLSLETGNTGLFAAANRLYESAGFTRCGPFGEYAATDFTHFYTREI